jgi:alpha-glucosidase
VTGDRETGHAWWQTGVIYQIYPRSFQDTNGDGVGDLPGIVSRLEYLATLGVDVLWLSPIFPSPMADFGYDITDYCNIDPLFGTLRDFDRLIAAAHQRGLRIILDYVPNHTSDRHPWFIESRSSRHNPQRDWYIWRDPKPDGSPPSNWLSEFGGSAWTYDAATGQFYYHAYLKEQPDLNWRNPEVRRAMLDVLRFWFARGVDGFRVDAIHHLIESAEPRDNPPNPEWREGMSPARRVLRAYTMDQPEVHDAIAAMRRLADSYDDRVLIGEAYLPIDRLVAYYGVDLTGFHLPFNFHLIATPWNPIAIAALIQAYEAALPDGAWPNWVLGNHDRSRLASRIGRAQARIAAMLLLTLRGTPTIYQGEELGLTDVAIPPELVQDPWEKNVPGLGLGRDPVRTPMPWDGGPNAGFTPAGCTTSRPWLPIGPDNAAANMAAQQDNLASMLALYRRLLALRRSEPALSIGAYVPLAATDAVLAYQRHHAGRRLLIALNFTAKPQSVDIGRGPAMLLLSTGPDRPQQLGAASIVLRPDEGIIVAIP